MSEGDNDDLDPVAALPVFDTGTSKFEWQEKQMKAPKPREWTTYGFEIDTEGGKILGYIADDIRVGVPRATPEED